VQALIADPEASREAPPEPVVAPATRPCANCGAPLEPGQGWCLECGTAAPGSLGSGPGWRQALTVIGLTLLIVGGAVAASYAALSSQSKRATTAPKIVAVAPTPAPPAAPATPATPPAATAPAVPPKAPATTIKPLPLPKATATPKAAVPPIVTPTPTPTKTTPSTGGHSNQTGQVGRAILLDPNAASTYNPYNLPDTSFGDPSLAIDGDSTTAWTYTLDPSTAGKTAVGLTVDLKSPQRFQSLKIHVTSPGMTVEFYGANGDLPVSITDPAWTHLANRGHIKKQTSVALKTAGKTFRWLLIWITHAPGSATTGTVGVAEVAVVR
jgi:hypothetical protein